MRTSEIKHILDTLPINFYTRDNAEYSRTYVHGQKDTYINLVTKEITIGLDMFDELDNVTEQEVRTLFYHEVSHGILTDLEIIKTSNFYKSMLRQINPNLPKEFVLGGNELHQVLNIIEDERIETILRDYYLDVNFTDFITRVADENTSTGLGKFFTATRLHKGDQALVQRIQDELKPLLTVNPTVEDYARLVTTYLELRETSQNDESQQQEESDNQQCPNGDGGGSGSKVVYDQDIPEDENSNSTGKDKNDKQNTKAKINKLTKEEQEEIISKSLDKLKASNEKAEQKKALRTEIKSNTSIESLIRKISLKGKTKDNKAIARRDGYGYVNNQIDVHRAINMKDNHYKIFKNKNGNKPSHKKHVINFYIDASGSFSGNQEIVNEMLTQLMVLEKKLGHTFEFTLTTIRHNNETELFGDNRLIHADGGTSISKNLKKIFKKNNKPDSHNILLLDGYSDVEDTLTYLDVRNMYLAVDDSNATHFSHFKRAKVDLVTGDYAEHLQDFIINTLFSILRNL